MHAKKLTIPDIRNRKNGTPFSVLTAYDYPWAKMVDAAGIDIALVGDDIKALPHLLLLAKRTMRTIHVNLAVSMILNFAAIALAITGVLNPVVGALVHNVGSVAVILNSSLLLKWREKESRAKPLQNVRGEKAPDSVHKGTLSA